VTQTSARRVALAALKIWRTKTEFADAIIFRLLSGAALESADRAFAVELFYGILRNLTLLDFWIGELRSARVDADLRDLLRLGLYQLFIAKTPQHAAVYETVAVAPKAKRPIVNAILRSAIHRRRDLQEKANSKALETQFSHPKYLIERWRKNFGTENTLDLCGWNNRPPPLYARINFLKNPTTGFFKNYPTGSFLLPNQENFLYAPTFPSEAVAAGLCYVQDPSTAMACELLQPKPGEKILDACAAPGGKTGYLAELMDNEGLIVACDRDPHRLRLLKENLRRLGVAIAKIVCFDWTQDQIPNAIRSKAPFDRILIDAPCSNTGVMRRRVDVRWRLRPSEFARMRTRQIEIVRAILPLLKSNGTLVYSTCSLEREENEEVVQHLVEKMSTLQLEEEQHSLPFRENFDGAFAARLRGSA
jgi:16S rRNA (cytosine967-C5)-methyltransferase